HCARSGEVFIDPYQTTRQYSEQGADQSPASNAIRPCSKKRRPLSAKAFLNQRRYLFLGIRVAARIAECEFEAGTPGCKFHKCQARKYGGSYIRIPMVNVGQYQGTPVAPHVLYERTNFLTGTIFLSNDVLHNDVRSAPAVQEKVAPNG